MAHNTDNDYKFWLVVNPATWLVPIFLALLAVAVIVHVSILNASPRTTGSPVRPRPRLR